MPIVDITLFEGRSPQQKLALMEKVTQAIVESIGVKPEGVRVILREIPPEHFAVGGVPKKMPGG